MELQDPSSMSHIQMHGQQAKEFQCPICQKFFSRKFSLEMHLLIHKGVKPHACPFCGRCFRQKGTLMRHKALHSNTALFQCGLCNKSYRQKNVFLHHLKHTHKVSTENLDRRKCRTQILPERHGSDGFLGSVPSFADQMVNSSEALILNSYKEQQDSKEHLPKMVDGNGSLVTETPCTVGVIVTPRSSSLVRSSKIFSENHWICNICSFAMEFDQAACSYHLNMHKKDYPFECFQCCILFAKRSDLNVHLMECHLDSPVGHPDTTSLQPSLNLADLQLFYGSFPYEQGKGLANPDSSTSDVTFTCIPCQLDFHSEDDFECHVKTHVQSVLCDSSDGESVKSCGHEPLDVCSSSKLIVDLTDQCTDPESEQKKDEGTPLDLLNAVVAGTHSVLETLSNVDNSTKATTNRLKTSQESPKRGSKTSPESSLAHYKRVRKRMGKLNSSRRTLRAPKNVVHLYCCPFCNEKFGSKNLLGQHSLSHLTGTGHPRNVAKAFGCKRCPKRFGNRVLSMYHLQMHLDARPFRCGACHESFSRKCFLLKHTRLRHMKVHPCTECGRHFQYRVLLRSHRRHCRSQLRDNSPVHAPVIDLNLLDLSQAKNILGVIPLKQAGSSGSASFGIPVIAPSQVGRLNLMLPVIGSVSLSPHAFRGGNIF